MTQNWFEMVNDDIVERMEEFYETFYSDTEVRSLGGTVALEPCPLCGHKGCCRVTEVGVHCFSCGWKGSHIKAWTEYATSILKKSQKKAYTELAQFTGIKMEAESPEMIEARKKATRIQEIRKIARSYYHDKLINSTTKYDFNGQGYTPMAYLLNVRQRKPETINQFHIGFSEDYFTLRQELMAQNYTAEEIKSAQVWMPDGVFVYFYEYPLTGDIVRMNIKNPFRQKDQENKVIEGFSVGNKVFYYAPGFTFNEDFIVVEGENDVQAVYEAGYKNVVGIGGNIRDEQFSFLRRAKKKILAWFDNDDAGRKYLTMLNSQLPEKKIYQIPDVKGFKDPDAYLISESNSSVALVDLINNAVLLPTDEYWTHNSSMTEWVTENRFNRLEFKITGRDQKFQPVGKLSMYKDGKLVDQLTRGSLAGCRVSFRPASFFMLEATEKILNSHFADRTDDELAELLPITTNVDDIINILAERYCKISDPEKKDNMIVGLTEKLRGRNDASDIIDKVLKEANEKTNRDHPAATNVPRIKISQYFNIKDNIAYFYYTKVKYDGDTVRKIPYLLRNDKQSIRLDLYKRKDEQCLLLIDNRYELIQEQPTALNSVTLTQQWVEKWVDGEIPQAELSPRKLVKEIEEYVRRFYYTTDDNVYKIVAVYAMLTYYYEALGEVPYLYFNGEKGSGKSILDSVMSIFCFNAKMGVSMSEASLFRLTSIEGGTLILDEIENLTSRRAANDNPLAPILKGGYTRNANIYRVDSEDDTVKQYDAFGPKIISNISGLEDIVLDRCIQINTYRLKVTSETRMEDPRYFQAEHQEEIAEVTSKCCLSALTHFQELYKIFRACVFEAGTARLSQILTTMLAVCKLIDKEEILPEGIIGEYETALKEYYENTIISIKEDIDDDTPEGVLKRLLPRIAKELTGEIPESKRELTNTKLHKYQEPITYNLDEGWFEVNVVHLKCFLEEYMPGEGVWTKHLTRYIETAFRMSGTKRRQVIHIENEELLKEFKGNEYPKVRVYKFWFRDFLGDDFLKDDSTDESENQQSDSVTSPEIF